MGRRATTIVGRSRRFLNPSDAGRSEIVLEAPLMLVLATLALTAGSRAAWIFLAFVAIGDIAVVVFGETRHPTTTFMLNAVVLGLLLAPSTRRWLRARVP